MEESQSRVAVAEVRDGFGSPGTGECQPLYAVTRGLVKTQQAEKTQIHSLVNCKACRTMIS